MKTALLAFVFCVAGLMQAPLSAKAQCVANALNGMVAFQTAGCFGAREREVKLTMHRNDGAFVAHSVGRMGKTAAGVGVSSNRDLLFDDRFTGSQPFNIAAAEKVNITLNPNNTFTIHISTWGYTTTMNATCSGNLVVGNNGTETYLLSFGPPVPLFC